MANDLGVAAPLAGEPKSGTTTETVPPLDSDCKSESVRTPGRVAVAVAVELKFVFVGVNARNVPLPNLVPGSKGACCDPPVGIGPIIGQHSWEGTKQQQKPQLQSESYLLRQLPPIA